LAYNGPRKPGDEIMKLTIELLDEQKAALAAKAQAHGLSLEEYARQVLQRDLAPGGWLQKSLESAKEANLDQLSMEEIDAEIVAARNARREPRFQPGT
jgi:plasmid stability protein